jgi:hypothetical protein
LRDVIDSGSTTQVLDEHVDTGDTIGALTKVQEAIDATLGMIELIDTISVKLAPPAGAVSVSLIFSVPELLQQSAGSHLASLGQEARRTASSQPKAQPPNSPATPQISGRHDAPVEDRGSAD